MKLLTTLAVPALTACLACSGGDGGSDVSGVWCGIQVTTAAECVGDEVIYAELAQSGKRVTGRSCVRYLTDCHDIQNGSLMGQALTFDYALSNDRVDAMLTLSADGEALSGTYASTKCACDVPATLHRLP
jgi:hypothetical protein